MISNFIFSETLEELTEMVVPLFESIKNLNVTPKEWPQHPLSEPYLGKQITIVPIMDFRSLEIVFPIPTLGNEFRSRVRYFYENMNS